MIVTDDDRIATLARSMRNQGRGEMGTWLEHERLGYNYRMDEMSAALGVSQMNRLDTMLEKRFSVAEKYTSRLSGFVWLECPMVRPHVRMSWFVYVVTLAKEIDRSAIVSRLESNGVPSRAYFPPVHLQSYMKKYLGDDIRRLPVTEDVAQRTLALPFHANLSDEEIDTVVRALSDAVESM